MRKKILFVCSANTCRSAVAEAILFEYGRDRYDASSAGIYARDGAPMMTLGFGGVSLSEREGKLQNDATGQSVKLGAKEYQLMELFLRNPGQILPKETLIERVWGYDSDTEYNSLEVYVSFLRKKLGFIGAGVKLKATRGLGYALEENHD